MSLGFLDLYDKINAQLKTISSGLIQVSKLTNTPFLAKLTGSTNTTTKNVIIYVYKNQANSIDQIEWIKTAKTSFPNTCLVVCIIRKINGTIPALLELKDHRKYSHARGKKHLSDNEFYKLIQQNSNVDAVRVVSHHLDIESILYDYVMLTKNDMTQIFNHYKNYVYNYNDHNNKPSFIDPTISVMTPLFPNFNKKNAEYPIIKKITNNSKNDINFLIHTTPNVLTYTGFSDILGNQIILDAEGNSIKTDVIGKPLYSKSDIVKITETLKKMFATILKIKSIFTGVENTENKITIYTFMVLVMQMIGDFNALYPPVVDGQQPQQPIMVPPQFFPMTPEQASDPMTTQQIFIPIYDIETGKYMIDTKTGKAMFGFPFKDPQTQQWFISPYIYSSPNANPTWYNQTWSLLSLIFQTSADFMNKYNGEQRFMELFIVITPIIEDIIQELTDMKTALRSSQLSEYLPIYYNNHFPSINRDRWAIWCDSIFIVPKYTPVRKNISLFDTLTFTDKIGYIVEKIEYAADKNEYVTDKNEYANHRDKKTRHRGKKSTFSTF